DRLTRSGSFNWGDLLNHWVVNVTSYSREEALQDFLKYLQEEGKKEVDQITWVKVGAWIKELYERTLGWK
ncbi:MAG: hypothetical protein IJV52_00040, partial [Prevotella sp.]|nr:hypothetical protein [Prevotella sp.]